MITFDLFILKVKLFWHNKPLLLVLKAWSVIDSFFKGFVSGFKKEFGYYIKTCITEYVYLDCQCMDLIKLLIEIW